MAAIISIKKTVDVFPEDITPGSYAGRWVGRSLRFTFGGVVHGCTTDTQGPATWTDCTVTINGESATVEV